MAAKFEIYKDKSGEFRWRLIHTNGQVIANSGEATRLRQTQWAASIPSKRMHPTRLSKIRPPECPGLSREALILV